MSEDSYVAGNPRWAGSDRLVVLSGCSGGGKSALLAEMARRGRRVFPEAGRQVVREETFIGGGALPWVYEALVASYGRYGYEVAVVPKAAVAARADFVEAAMDGA